jgi:AraC-like DNA-binding protein
MPGSNQNEPHQSDPLAAEQEHTDEKIQLPDLDSWKQQIETLMLSDKLYENPELSITDISTKLNTHSKRISQVINQGFGMNFNDFINRYRVEAVVDKMNEGGHLNQTLLSLAFESGFNSKSTFNRAFKRTTGMSPNEYVEKKFKK